MIGSIADLIRQQSRNPGMMLPVAQEPYRNDLGVMDMNEDYGLPQNLQTDDPKSLSRGIQEWLGAREPDQGGSVQDILAGRFQPTFDDISQGAVQTLFSGKPVSSREIADDRLRNHVERLKMLSDINGGSGGSGGSSVFAQTMAAINADPELSKLSAIDKIRMAQNKLGTNLTIGSNGVVAMGGAPAALGELAYGEQRGATQGKKEIELQYDPMIAGQESQARNAADMASAAGIAEQKEIGSLSGKKKGEIEQKAIMAIPALNLINEAKKYLPYATSGGLAKLVAKGKGFAGYSDESTQADAQLDVISATLLNNVPRMEGPQSDFDRMAYEKAAGDIGNRAKPIGDRAAALRVIENLQMKYAGMNQDNDGFAGNLTDLSDEELLRMLQ